jgi:DHA2 family multidrug resistance protein
MLARSAQTNAAYLAEHLTAYDSMRWEALGATPGSEASAALLAAEIGRQASAIAYSNDFYLLALLAIVMLPLGWTMKMRRDAGPATARAADGGGH